MDKIDIKLATIQQNYCCQVVIIYREVQTISEKHLFILNAEYEMKNR